MYKNEVRIDESWHYSYYSESSGTVIEQGGRTLVSTYRGYYLYTY